jgi:hypothetical protein
MLRTIEWLKRNTREFWSQKSLLTKINLKDAGPLYV